MCRAEDDFDHSMTGFESNELSGLFDTIEQSARAASAAVQEATNVPQINEPELDVMDRKPAAVPDAVRHSPGASETRMAAIASDAPIAEDHKPDAAASVGARTKKRRRSSKGGSAHHDTLGKDHHRHSTVHHDYHDYSNSTLDDEHEAALQEQLMEKKGRGGISSPFPTILHQMLENAYEDGFDHIVSWQPHGRAFLVHDQKRFVDEVMPRYFRQTRFSSFQRQLSLYGFLRLTRKGPDHGAYYNELCLRGMPHLAARIQRTRVKGYWVRQSASPETEPNFYEMPAVGIPEPTSIAEIKRSPPLIAYDQPMPPLSASMPINFNMLAAKNLPSQAFQQGELSAASPFTRFTMGTNLAYRPDTGGSMKIAPPDPSFWSDTDLGARKALRGVDKLRPGSPETAALKADFLELPITEQEDLAAFLSDVDLESDDEEEEVYRKEEELERIYAAKHARHSTDI